MRLLPALKKLFSNDDKRTEFEKSLPHRLRGAAADVQLQNFEIAQRQLLEVLGHRDQISDQTLLRITLQTLGSTWYLRDLYQPGFDFFSNYIDRYPQDADGYSQRGMMLWYSGKNEEAVRDFSRALDQIPDDLYVSACRGQVFAELGQNDEALADLDRASRALDRYASWDLAWRRRSQAYIENGRATAFANIGDFDAALKHFENSMHLCADNAWVYYNRARAYEARGDPQKAVADYQRALSKRDPKLPLHKIENAKDRLRVNSVQHD